MAELHDIFQSPLGEHAIMRLFEEKGKPACDIGLPWQGKAYFISYVEHGIADRVGTESGCFCDGALREMLVIFVVHLQRKFSSIFSEVKQTEDEQGWVRHFEKYPLLRLMVLGWVDDFVDYASSFVLCCASSLSSLKEIGLIAESETRIKRTSCHDTDVHDGKFVVMLEFEQGSRLVFKPRKASADRLLEGFTHQVARYCGSLDFKFPQYLETDQGTFYEYIDYRPAQDIEGVRRYFQRLGFMSCIHLFLGGNDLHGENIIAQGEYPVFIDAETCASEHATTADLLRIRRLSLLPTAALHHDYYLLPDACCAVKSGSNNLPWLPSGEKRTGYQHSKDFISGFSTAYQGVLENGADLCQDQGLAGLFDCTVRILLENTVRYDRMLCFLARSESLKNTDSLNTISAKLGARNMRSDIPPACTEQEIRAEIEYLKRGYIPLILRRYQGVSSNPLYQAFCARVQLASREHLAHQVAYMQIALHDSLIDDGCKKFVSIPPKTDVGSLEKEVETIFEYCITGFSQYMQNEKQGRALVGGLSKSNRLYMMPDAPCLPECAFGLLPALAAWNNARPTPKSMQLEKDLTSRVFESYEDNDMALCADGLAHGKGGMLLVSNILCGLGRSATFAPVRQSIIDAVLNERLDNWNAFDYKTCSLLFGCAGTMLALGHLPKELRNDEIRDRINHYARRVLTDTASGQMENLPDGDLGQYGRVLACLLVERHLSDELAEKTNEIVDRILPLLKGAMGVDAILTLYSEKQTLDEPFYASECQCLRFGNATLVEALLNNGRIDEAQAMASRMTSHLMKRVDAGQALLGEPEGSFFPSLVHGYGGVLYALARSIDPTLPPMLGCPDE